MTQLPDRKQLLAPYIERLREIGIDDARVSVSHYDWTLYTKRVGYGNISFPSWERLERYARQLVATSNFDPIALGM